MILLIDMGNSRLKWAVCQNQDDISPIHAIANDSLTEETLVQLWQNYTPPEKLVVSVVSNSQLAHMVSMVVKRLWPDSHLIFASSQAYAYGLRNAYLQPETLGVDRWLGMIAAYRRYPRGFCLVDCGTAVTLDVVDATGKHLGGMICPGLRLMAGSLAKGTAKLGLTEAVFPAGLANNTAAAIYNGTISAACGLVEHALANYAKAFQIILTGGDAEMIAERLAKPVVVEPALVLCGLAMLSSSP